MSESELPQIMEWISILIPVIAIIIVIAIWMGMAKAAKRASYENYKMVEKFRSAIGERSIRWRGSMAKYNDDIAAQDAHDFYKSRLNKKP